MTFRPPSAARSPSIASGKPVKPSQQTINTSATPRLRSTAELEVQLDRRVRRFAPSCSTSWESAPVVAGQVITSWSHRGRVRSDAAFAKLGGAAPIEASSGTITRHRLNRSGDRQLNLALHTIVLVRMRQDCATKDYIQRRLARARPSATSSGA